ncbi:glycosyltransferase family 2 protein [uncultured Tateyamaria sp.]|uniref:glycosyltransferase family 2 protein n=1 Tax=Tateyamaria sp. 1078 TaxID=3417464 RepID=UPI00261204FA|nr:glycosyltransferase family 2 protein [uncultured Tateyamaria sp.]
MSDPLLRLPAPQPVARAGRPAVPVGRQLVDAGVIDQGALLKALNLQHYIDAPLGEILVATGDAAPADVLTALSVQYGAEQVDLSIDPPATTMSDALPATTCQRYGAVPWRWFGRTLLVATDRPDRMRALRASLGPDAPRILPVVAERAQVIAQISALYGGELAHRALTRLPGDISSRTWTLASAMGASTTVLLLGLLIMGLVLMPAMLITILVAISVLSLLLTTGLKAGALVAQLMKGVPSQTAPLAPVPLSRMPKVSMLVPLFHEENIADALIKRLTRLTYPKALLEVVLVLEAKDTITRDTIARTKLPHWMRVIEVPDDGTITTKPRALNYALDFCQGQIVGIWDAEDAPEPDQLEKAVARFAQAGPKTVCLQGILDYYNARQNWLSRCFTIEYAAWWRLVLPGAARMGLALPLGGTTLFFRRDILEELGGWDAHNVTEDADLGIRLARAGYVTELIPTVTMEEANCHPWAWIKQRSRWIKGFLITYCVHMRRPRQLLRDLGPLRFLGIQAMFLGTVVQFATLPLLWSFWLPVFGVTHPVTLTAGAGVMWPLAALFITSELISIVVSVLAVSDRTHRHLVPWVLTMPFYFPLAAVAAYKGLYELIVAPFYWDKTQHGRAAAP